jgi:hypothetical protein
MSAIRLNNFLYQNGRIADFIDLGDEKFSKTCNQIALFGDLFFL